MQVAASAPRVRVRAYEPRDGPAVRAFWRAGFMEMAWDMTRTLGPVGPPQSSSKVLRPALAAVAAVGGARLALSLARREAPGRATLAALGLGLGGIAALHVATRALINAMCDEATTTGDMGDISAHWQVAGESAFFVAELADGTVVGSVAVRRGGLQEDESALPGTRPLKEPRSCSVWKVSTSAAARGAGVARLLMAEAERWASAEARAERMVLMTASPGAKVFYAKLGYALQNGSTRGTQFSVWTKPLYAADAKEQ